jgi:hypothetical protein
MQLPTIPKIDRLSRKHKITAAGAAAAAGVVLTVTGLQATSGTAVAAGDPTGISVSTGDQVKSLDAQAGMASQRAIADDGAAKKQAAADAAAQQKAAADSAVKKKAGAAAEVKQKAAAQANAKKKATAAAEAKREQVRQAASRAEQRAALTAKPVEKVKTVRAVVKAAPKAAPKAVAPKAAPKAVHKAAHKAVAPKAAPKAVHKAVHRAAPVSAKTYANNLDGWIRESRAILAAHNIPGSYDGIHRNIIRESSGNPNAINLWDSNAAAGIPSKGLLQVIDPTFQAFHVQGTSWNIYNPVANITAACNYAHQKYGSMDNVDSAY